MRIFISHSSADAALAGEICRDLEDSGYSCFIAPRDIRSGCEYAEELINGIDGCDLMVLLLSEQSNGSPHVLREVERAVSKNKPIVVYKLEEVSLTKSMEYFLMTHQWLERKPGRERSEIIGAIEQFSRERRTAPSPATHEPKPGKKNRKIICLSAAATVILAALVTAFSLGAHRQGELMEPSGDSSAPEISAGSSDSASLTDCSTVSSDNASLPENHAASSDSASLTENPAPSSDSASLPENPASSSDSTTAQEIAAAPQGNTAALPPETSVQPAAATSSPPQTTIATEKPSETASQAEPPTEPSSEDSPAVPEPGSSLFLGTYNGQPVEWRVVHIADNGRSAVVISDKILTMKAFDAAESGHYNQTDSESYWTTPMDDLSVEQQRALRGDNRWEYSNIRTWLNSAREMVQYSDYPPAAGAMSEHDNGYSTEAGFLRGFTKDELAAILPTEITTNGSTTTDRVFLLSSDEMQWLYDADVSIFARPTPEALEQDSTGWYAMYLDACGTDEYLWWLRDADGSNACKSLIVNNSSMDSVISAQCVGLEGFGIRPAMTIDLSSPLIAGLVQGAE